MAPERLLHAINAVMRVAVSADGLKALGLALAFGALSSAPAADYYVATSGSDSNPGTSAQPFRTITHAYAYAAPGVTIHVMPGTYYDYTSRWGIHLGASGTPAQPIVLHSEVRGAAIIDGQNAANRNEGFYIDGDYNVVDGFEIRNCPNGGISIWSDGNQILNNRIHHNGNLPSPSPNGKDGIYSSHDTTGNVYQANCIDHNGRPGSNLDHGLYLCGNNEVVLNNVLFANAATGLQVAGYTTVNNMKVYNNVMAWNGTSGIVLWQALNGVDIKNNIFYQNGRYGIFSYAATGGGVVVDNNFSYGNGSGDFDFTGGGSTYTNSQAGNIFADPGLVDGTLANFDPHLASGSPAIQAALNLYPDLTTDMAGAARPSSGAWDLGVYLASDTVPGQPRVTLSTTTPIASRTGSSSGVFTITRSGDTTQALSVTCVPGGSAVNGQDYTALGITLTIPAGSASTTVLITPLPSAGLVGPETVVLTVAPGSGYSPAWLNQATVVIGGNNVLSTISLAPGNNAKITWASAPGKIYRVASKNSLSDPGWTDSSGLITAASGSTSFTDPTTSSRAQRFYVVYQTN